MCAVRLTAMNSFIKSWKDGLQIISREPWFNNQKNVDSRRLWFWLDKQWRNACIKLKTCLYKPLQFFPIHGKWSACFSSKILKVFLLWWETVCVSKAVQPWKTVISQETKFKYFPRGWVTKLEFIPHCIPWAVVLISTEPCREGKKVKIYAN